MVTEDLLSERVKLRRSFLLPVLFVTLLWAIHLLDVSLQLGLNRFGTRPRELSGLTGIITTPLLHANYEHLISNTVPLLLLGTMVCYFYRQALLRVVAFLYLLGGFWLWVLGKPDQMHVGASGLIYALVSFLFFAGVISRHRGMMAVALLTIFLYSSLVLGIIPFLVPENVSWQGHLAGSLAGIFAAFYFKDLHPEREEFKWEDEEPEITDDPEAAPRDELHINYHFVPGEDAPGKEAQKND